MKKLITFALASVMALASSMLVLADAEPIAAITNTYTFENALQNENTVDQFHNPFKDGGYDTVSIQYTVSIPTNPKYFSGYDTVMTFGTKTDGLVYICNELVGMNDGGFADYWPSGTRGVLAYPGKGQSYTVNLVFSSEGVAFYCDGEMMPGSNISAENTDGTVGDRTGTDLVNSLNLEDYLYIGDNLTSYWAAQDMVLSNIVFFKGDQTTPYTLTGAEPQVVRVGSEPQEEEETTTKKKNSSSSEIGVEENTTTEAPVQAVDPDEGEEESQMLTMVMIIVIVVVVLALGVSAMVIMSSKRRR